MKRKKKKRQTEPTTHMIEKSIKSKVTLYRRKEEEEEEKRKRETNPIMACKDEMVSPISFIPKRVFLGHHLHVVTHKHPQRRLIITSSFI